MQCWSFVDISVIFMNSYSGFSFHYVGDECSICKETFVAADIKSNLKCAHGLYSVVLRSLQKYKKKKL